MIPYIDEAFSRLQNQHIFFWKKVIGYTILKNTNKQTKRTSI